MNTEWEAKFLRIDKDELRAKLKVLGAVLAKSEFRQRRVAFHLPKSVSRATAWVRVRDEGDRVTMSIKEIRDNLISGQKEVMLVVDNYEQARDFLINLGCEEKAYQETNREIWNLGEVEIMIDEWPFLEPFVEIEGGSEDLVREVTTKLGLNWSEAYFGAADGMISQKYGISIDRINNQTPRIVFGEKNPFV